VGGGLIQAEEGFSLARWTELREGWISWRGSAEMSGASRWRMQIGLARTKLVGRVARGWKLSPHSTGKRQDSCSQFLITRNWHAP